METPDESIVAFGTMAGQFAYDPDTFDEVDLEILALFEAE